MTKRVTRKVSDETKRKMSAAHKGRKNGMWKRKHSVTTKLMISEALRRYWKHLPKV